MLKKASFVGFRRVTCFGISPNSADLAILQRRECRWLSKYQGHTAVTNLDR